MTTIIKCRPIRIKSLTVSRTIGTTISFSRCREIIIRMIKLIPNSISSSSNQALQTTTTRRTNTITQLSILLIQERICKNRRYCINSYRKYSVARNLRMSPSFALLTIAGLNLSHCSKKNLSLIAIF